MTDTTLKFGPEWLRALTEPQQGTVNYTPPLPNMKLAEFRYGREEMLALFDKDVLPPDELLTLGSLYVEKCQFPLNLIQMGDEETRAWQKGANSDASQRPYGVHGKRPNSPSRGRAKCRGGASYPDYDRKKMVDEEYENARSRPDRESRSYQHGKGRGGGMDRFGERGWLEVVDKANRDEERDNSPRKGYTKAPCDDWRVLKTDNPKTKEDGWRTGLNRGWGGSAESSWRSDSCTEFGKMNLELQEEGKKNDRWRREDKNQQGRRAYGGRKKDLENLPEWVMENPSEDVEGGFDESGKYNSELIFSKELESSVNQWGEQEKWHDEEEEADSDILNCATDVLVSSKENKVKSDSYCMKQTNEIEQVAENIIASIVNDDDNKNLIDRKPPEDRCDETSWTYLDPQGQVQGPFRSEEMLEWYTAGYFPHDLMIRRSLDEKFTSLAEMCKLYGKNPFTPGLVPPPLNSDVEHVKQQQLLHMHHLYIQQQHQQQLLAQQQLLMMQQQSPALTRMYHNVVTAMNDPLGSLLMNLNKPIRNPVHEGFTNNVPECFTDSAPRDGSSLDTEVVVDLPRKNTTTDELDPIQSLLRQLQNKHCEDGFSNEKSGNEVLKCIDDKLEQTSIDIKLNSDVDIEENYAKCNEYNVVQVKMVDQKFNVEHKCEEGQTIEKVGDTVLYTDEEKDPTTFQVPKSSEKREKKNRKAEERRKAKSAKIQRELPSSNQYIPGMPGCTPTDTIKQATNESCKIINSNDSKPETLLMSLHDAQGRDEYELPKKEKCSKPAPWANKATADNDQERNLSLQDIQKLEAEKVRLEKAARELADAEKKETKRREEEERSKRIGKPGNWAAATINTASSRVKSLAEIQEEEAKNEKEKLEKVVQERNKKMKDSVTRSKIHTSWAGKIAAAAVPSIKIPVNNQQAPIKERANLTVADGFWEASTSKQTSKPVLIPSSKKKKKVTEDKVVCVLTKHFDEWCKNSLENLDAQVDIPTFLAFLRDIESPDEVHDYIKTYVGEGKVQRKFAVEYVERRSQWRNAKRRGSIHGDDLTTPAYALIPGDGDFQEATRKNKKKGKNSKSSLNHLLGFSIQGQGVNRGELDIPQ